MHIDPYPVDRSAILPPAVRGPYEPIRRAPDRPEVRPLGSLDERLAPVVMNAAAGAAPMPSDAPRGALGPRTQPLAARASGHDAAAPDAARTLGLAGDLLALHRSGMLDAKELELLAYAYVVPWERQAAAVLALGQAIADRRPSSPPIGALEDLMEWRPMQAHAATALMKAYRAGAEAGIEPPWARIDQFIHRYDDRVLVVIEDWMPALCAATREAGLGGPERLLGDLASDRVTTDLAERLRRGIDEALARAARPVPATDYQLDAPPLEPDPATWLRTMRFEAWLARYATRYQGEEAATRATLNAHFRRVLEQRYPMTPGFRAFLDSADFLDSDIQQAWAEYLFMELPAPFGGANRRPTLALPHEVLVQGTEAVNIVKIGAFTIEDYDESPKHYMGMAAARLPHANLIQIDWPLAGLALDEEGRPNARAAFVLKPEATYLTYFRPGECPPAHYVLDFSKWVAPRSGCAGGRYASLAGLQGVPHVHGLPYTQPYVDHKAFLVRLAQAGVAVPEALYFLSRGDPLPAAARARLASAPGVADAGALTAAELDARIAAFIDAHGIAHGIVVKPAAEWSGRGVAMFAVEDRRGMAAHIRALDAAGMTAVLQRRVQGPPLMLDGRAEPWNMRVLVSPDESGEPQVGGLIVRAGGEGGVGARAFGAEPLLYEDVIERLKAQHPAWVEPLDGFEARVHALARQAHRVLSGMIRADGAQREPGEDPTVYVGFDMMADWTRGELRPVLVEVNGIDSGLGPAAIRLLEALGEDHPWYRKYEGGHLSFDLLARAMAAAGARHRDARRGAS